jgi:hypothetical protein
MGKQSTINWMKQLLKKNGLRPTKVYKDQNIKGVYDLEFKKPSQAERASQILRENDVNAGRAVIRFKEPTTKRFFRRLVLVSD